MRKGCRRCKTSLIEMNIHQGTWRDAKMLVSNPWSVHTHFSKEMAIVHGPSEICSAEIRRP